MPVPAVITALAMVVGLPVGGGNMAIDSPTCNLDEINFLVLKDPGRIFELVELVGNGANMQQFFF